MIFFSLILLVILTHFLVAYLFYYTTDKNKFRFIALNFSVETHKSIGLGIVLFGIDDKKTNTLIINSALLILFFSFNIELIIDSRPDEKLPIKRTEKFRKANVKITFS